MQIADADKLQRTVTVLIDLMNSYLWDSYYFTEEGMALFDRVAGRRSAFNNIDEIDVDDPDVRRRFLDELGIATDA